MLFRTRLLAALLPLLFPCAAVADAGAATLAAREAEATKTTPTTTGAGTGTATTQTSAIAVTGTTLPELAGEAESCVLICYNAACVDSGCNPGNFDCVCENPNSLVVKVGLCVGTKCDGSRPFDAGNWIADICDAFGKHPPSAEIASASSKLVMSISAVDATATDNPVPLSTTIVVNSFTGSSTEPSSTSTSSAAASASSSRQSHFPVAWTALAVVLAGGIPALATLLF